jgi:hypothetical protein
MPALRARAPFGSTAPFGALSVRRAWRPFLTGSFVGGPLLSRAFRARFTAARAFAPFVATTARVASTRSAFTTPAPAPSTGAAASTAAAATAPAASAATATATLIAALTAIVRRFRVLFTPLPVLQGIPIRVLLVRGRRLAGGLVRLAARRLLVAAFPALGFLAAAFLMALCFTPMFFATVRRLFGLVMVELVGRGFTDRFGIAWGAERGFQIEVGSKVVGSRRRSALFVWRTGWTALPAR